ncbi:MAG: mechanosensitive ion channel family protein [Leptolyngbyaceae cyanobacterium SL_1_1]|nr:mechanosensitive ion channel family protein [Leptolyngbyaceae cyanobacterium RM2_2_21]NJN01987.1 mechanosensitive ion channel family protein [Leptolyngbyaceae cyanobacterium RM1_1_2]NJO10118.1 mechanosensitive ion channel family protein [Leptolyngbyaceae cyanobacterium SL_1_1]
MLSVLKFNCRWLPLVAVGVVWTVAPIPLLAQLDGSTSELTAPASDSATQSSGLYFSDIIVRGRPLFQVGGLADISAQERAQIINRRIASIVLNTEDPGSVEAQFNADGTLATLRLNNRVLMTITQQDAEDFGLSLEALAQRWAEQLTQALNKPPLAIDVAQRINTTLRNLGRDTIARLPAFTGAFIIVLITWAVAGGVRYGAFRWAQQTEGDRSTEVLIGRLGYGGVWIIGSVVALGVMGLDFGALLGALGLTSVAIGFSLKDVLSNYISGVILLAARPFRLGDQVVIGDYEGTITQIQLRATTLKTYDGRRVYIPNQEVFQASIINNTASTQRRSSVIVGIDYDADIEKTKQVIAAAVQEIKGVVPEFPVEVLVRELAASTVNLEVLFWVDSRRGEFLGTTSAVAQQIKEALQQADVEMPTEIYTLLFRNAPPGIEDQIHRQQAKLSQD